MVLNVSAAQDRMEDKNVLTGLFLKLTAVDDSLLIFCLGLAEGANG